MKVHARRSLDWRVPEVNDADRRPAPADRDPEEVRGFDRRTLVKRAAATAGGVAVLGAWAGGSGIGAAAAAGGAKASGPLKARQMKTLEAVLECVIPKDELGPGAVEVGVPEYIQGALAGSYKPLVSSYGTFLGALDKAARSSGARSFADLDEAARIKMLEKVELGKAPGLPAAEAGAAAELFQLVLQHTREGMFGDPMYGGNKDLAGWKLIGYPGIQLVVSERLQQIGTKVPATGMTAESYGGAPYNGVPM